VFAIGSGDSRERSLTVFDPQTVIDKATADSAKRFSKRGKSFQPLTMAQISNAKPNASHHAVLAGFLGWTLDAFDFFVVVFLFSTLSKAFGVSKEQIVSTTFATWRCALSARCCLDC